MELQSDIRISSQSPPGTPRRTRPRRCPDGGGEDRIYAIPDVMLLKILVLLRCTHAAALTSSLSHRWRGLWRYLFELSFRDIPLDAIDAALKLKQVACPTLSRLQIEISERHRIMDPTRVSALLHAATRLAPTDLVVDVWGKLDYKIPIEIPCFQRATSIKLRIANLYLTLPARRVEFPMLERLSVAHCRFDNMNMVELISRCPHLRVLQVEHCWGLSTLKVHSATIEEIVVNYWLTKVDIVAPMLKNFRWRADMVIGLRVLFSVPMVESLSLSCSFETQVFGISEIWCVHSLGIRTEKSACVLGLEIYFARQEFVLDYPLESDLFQRIVPLPDFSILETHLGSNGHVFGVMMLDLLGTFSAIRRLKVIMQDSTRTQACPPDCRCDESPNWRSQTIPLMSLEEIEIDGFEGTCHEVDFLKLLFRCATFLKRMTVRLRGKLFVPSDRGYKEMLSIFEANPSVQCYVYRSPEWFEEVYEAFLSSII